MTHRSGLDPDLIDSSKGRGRPSEQAVRELREMHDPDHPRTRLSPMVDLEVADEQVALQGMDERNTHFSDTHHPKPFKGPEDPTDPVADDRGRVRDIMADTPPTMVELGDTDEDTALDADTLLDTDDDQNERRDTLDDLDKERITHLNDNSDLDQKAIADAFDIDRSTVSKIANNKL